MIDFTGRHPEYLFFLTDHLGSTRVVAKADGTVCQRNNYYPYGARFQSDDMVTSPPEEHILFPSDSLIGVDDEILPLPGISLPLAGAGQPYCFSGKELYSDTGLNLYDFNARTYNPDICRFTTIDPMAEKYYSLSPYAYCNNNPAIFVDPDGCSVNVKRLEDKTFEVIGGELNDDLNIYEFTQDDVGEYTIKGESIGVTATPYSFYDSDSNKWQTGSIINPYDNSGREFLSNIGPRTGLLEYMTNATENEFYDFKNSNGGLKKYSDSHYRGMPIDGINGQTVFASARDVGNIAAGIVASSHRIPWKVSRVAFDSLESIQRRKFAKEGLTTQSAQKYGYVIGFYRMVNQFNDD